MYFQSADSQILEIKNRSSDWTLYTDVDHNMEN